MGVSRDTETKLAEALAAKNLLEFLDLSGTDMNREM